MYRATIRPGQVAIELLHVRINRRVDCLPAAPEMEHAGRWNRHLCCSAGAVAQEAEMLQHRMAGESQPAHHAQAHRPGLDSAPERDAVPGTERLHSVEGFQEIEVP